MKQVQLNLAEHQQPSSSSSRQHKNKLYFILFFIILFATIISSIISVFTVFKHDIESEHRATSNPDNLVKEICRFAPYVHQCNKSMTSSLHYHRSNSDDDILLSDVLRLSISAAYDQLYTIRSLPKELGSTYKNSPIVEKALADCQSLFKDSLERLNKSLIMISEDYTEPKEKTFFYNDGEVVTMNLVDFIFDAGKNLQRCIDGLDRKGSLKIFESRVREAKAYVSNALAILENKDDIYRKLFKPVSVSSIFAASLMLDHGNYFVLVLFCSQYMMLMLLICVLRRVF